MQPSIQTKTFKALFDQPEVPPLPESTERAAIRAAQRGDKKAMTLLISSYMPLIKRVIGDWARGVAVRQSNDLLDEARSVALLTTLETIHAFDADRPERERLATVLPTAVQHAVFGLATSMTQISVPQRTLARYHSIMRKAEGNIYIAMRIAPEHHMSGDVLMAVHEAVRNVDSIDGLTAQDHSSQFQGTEGRDEGAFDANRYEVAGAPKWDSGFADAEDRILVEAALAALTDQEKEIVKMAYGFDERPLPDGEIANLLVMSRQKVQRLRSGALDKMRDRLGAI